MAVYKLKANRWVVLISDSQVQLLHVDQYEAALKAVKGRFTQHTFTSFSQAKTFAIARLTRDVRRIQAEVAKLRQLRKAVFL